MSKEEKEYTLIHGHPPKLSDEEREEMFSKIISKKQERGRDE